MKRNGTASGVWIGFTVLMIAACVVVLVVANFVADFFEDLTR